jgi:phage FluMu protein Com
LINAVWPFFVYGGITGTYFRTEAMVKGGPFRCYNCNKNMISEVGGSNYELKLYCQRCKATIVIKMKEPLPYKKTKDQAEREAEQEKVAIGAK